MIFCHWKVFKIQCDIYLDFVCNCASSKIATIFRRYFLLSNIGVTGECCLSSIAIQGVVVFHEVLLFVTNFVT